LYSTPREEEGVKVVFRKACCSNFTRAREKGIELQKSEREERRKKYSKKERKCLGFICYPKYWRNANTKIFFFREERGSERLRSSLCTSLVVFFFYDEDEENHRLKQR